jgi:hypothetical protein
MGTAVHRSLPHSDPAEIPVNLLGLAIRERIALYEKGFAILKPHTQTPHTPSKTPTPQRYRNLISTKQTGPITPFLSHDQSLSVNPCIACYPNPEPFYIFLGTLHWRFLLGGGNGPPRENILRRKTCESTPVLLG